MDKGLHLINQRTITYSTFKFDFDNGLSYVERRANARLIDCFFAETDTLFPDGSLKGDANHYFFCGDVEAPEKEIKPINCLTFDNFDYLWFINDEGKVMPLCGVSPDE